MNHNKNKLFVKSKNFNEALGLAKGIPSHIDFYRFNRVRSHISGNSILDVGCGRADFLKLTKLDYKIAGIEVNMKRVEYCNKILGKKVIMLGDLEEKIDLEDNCYDTVVCLEVLEHLIDPQKALKELIRISCKRVIITIPFKEKIKWTLCIHCGKYTPNYGHLHSFNKESILDIVPDNAKIVKIELVCNISLCHPGIRYIFRMPVKISSTIDKILNSIFPKARWMMIILDKSSCARAPG